jgi:membrane associated rhomboid family serine protease
MNGDSDYRKHDDWDGNNNTVASCNDAENYQPGEVNLLDAYEFRQKYGYLSIAFAIVQTLILIVMIIECGVAPLTINPMVGPYPDALSNWGAKNSALMLEDGENWRLLSPLLLHAGVLHLVGNVSVQMETGVFFEREWGSPVWFLIYMLSALGSSIMSVCLMPGTLSVGSSGAIMGIFGAKLAEIACRCCEPCITVQERVGHKIRQHHLVLSLGAIVIVMALSFIPFVDWAAHLGGLLAGMAVGLTVFSLSMRSIVSRIVWFLVGLSLTVVGFAVSLKYMYTQVEPAEQLRDICGYYQQFYEDYECSCTLDEASND